MASKQFIGKILCPHCGGDLIDHLRSMWGKFRSLHNKKRSGFGAIGESEHLVASQKGGRNSWDLSPEERAQRIKKAAQARWGKKEQ